MVSPIEKAWQVATDIREHLLLMPLHLDFDTPDAPAHHSSIVQLVFHFNRQNYMSLLGSLETDHVIPAAHLARALLEESIRWEWMTDEPDPRMGCLFGQFRKGVDAVRDECAKLGRDPEPFTNPTLFGDTATLGPYEEGTGFPPISNMVDQIEAGGKKDLKRLGAPIPSLEIRILYAHYRILSQLVHSSLLGMTATVQVDADGMLSIGQSVPVEWRALLLQTSAASMFNVARYTYDEFEDSPGELFPWIRQAWDLTLRMAEIAGPIHGLHTAT